MTSSKNGLCAIAHGLFSFEALCRCTPVAWLLPDLIRDKPGAPFQGEQAARQRRAACSMPCCHAGLDPASRHEAFTIG